MLYAEKNNIPGLLLMADFQKAFDTIAWPFIEKSLSAFNFGNDIKHWVKCFYTDITSCVYVNGRYSEWFDVQRGTRQGDPLSPYLFLLCAEILSIMIRQNHNIKGIKVGKIFVLLSQFADDTSFFLDGTKRSFCACIRTLTVFSRMSGLCINFEKSAAIWIGSQKGSDVKFMPEIGLQWNPLLFRILGVIFSSELKDMASVNFKNKLQEITIILNQWSRRNLTPFGKITVIKTLITSKLTYLFMTIPDPDEHFLTDLNKLLYKFLWNGKNYKIKRTSASQIYEVGGLKMMNVKCFLSALKINWLKRILNSDGKITQIVYEMCEMIQYVDKLGFEVAHVIMERVENPFWKDVFKHLKRLYQTDQCKPKTSADFVCECIFFNPNIKRDNVTIYLKKWFDAGVVYIGHLLGQDGFLTHTEFNEKYPDISVNFLLYQGVVRAIKRYQKKLEIEVVNDCLIDKPYIWQYLSKGGSKHIYSCLLPQCEPLKCIRKWGQTLNTDIIDKVVFTKLKKTTHDTRLRWLQYRILYRILPTGRFLFLRKITDSPVCCFCNNEEETLLHFFWNCQYVKKFWTDLEEWLHTKFMHCSNVTLSKEIIILGFKENFISDRIFDLIILLAKQYIFSCKQKGVIPHIKGLVNEVKKTYCAEKYHSSLNMSDTHFRDWLPYRHFFV